MLIGEKVKENIEKIFAKKLKYPVTIAFKGKGDSISNKTEQVLRELVSLNPKLEFEHNLDLDCIEPPCFSIYPTAEEDLGIRYMGEINGGEIQTIIDTIVMVSTKNHKISPRIEELVKQVDKDIEIKVFTTSSCGFCAPAIKIAYSFALVNSFIKTVVIDSYTFPHIAMKYNVVTVPKIVINNKVEFFGAKEDNEFFGYILQALEA
ncbi:MAG: glutaredoxin [Aquificae bacterium]|nr:glutaredoxin [Aquificota bacterium]